MTLPKPPRTEIWLRKIYAPYMVDGTLTTIFRPERRLLSEGHPKALGVGEVVGVRIIDKVGADWAGIYGVLLDEPQRKAEITGVTVRPFGSFKPEDFRGSTPDVQDLEGLRNQLALIYNYAAAELCAAFDVTRTTFRYLPKEGMRHGR